MTDHTEAFSDYLLKWQESFNQPQPVIKVVVEKKTLGYYIHWHNGNNYRLFFAGNDHSKAVQCALSIWEHCNQRRGLLIMQNK